jgi:hypothetical protein
MTIVVSNARQEDVGEFFDLVADVKFDSRTRPLKMRRIGNHPGLRNAKPSLDPFAAMLLMPAMIRGEGLVIEGEVDEHLLYNLRGLIQNILRVKWHRWSKIKVSGEARATDTAQSQGAGAAAGFSGGIDSMHLFRHCFMSPEAPESMRLSLLLHHHVGAHCQSDSLFRVSFAHAQTWADRHGLPLVGTICDVDEYYRGSKFEFSAILRNAAAAIGLNHLYQTFLYAAAVRMEGDRKGRLVEEGENLGAMLLPLFESRHHRMRLVGGEYSRFEKTLQVLSDERLVDHLYVCARPPERRNRFLNCGTCSKCVKLLVVAEHVGRIDRLEKLFDIASYRRSRMRCLSNLIYSGLTRRSISSFETLGWLKREGFEFPRILRPAVLALA